MLESIFGLIEQLSIGSVLESLLLRNPLQRNRQRVKRASGDSNHQIVILILLMHRSLDRSIVRAIDRSLDRSIARTLDRSFARSLDRSIARSLHRWSSLVQSVFFVRSG